MSLWDTVLNYYATYTHYRRGDVTILNSSKLSVTCAPNLDRLHEAFADLFWSNEQTDEHSKNQKTHMHN